MTDTLAQNEKVTATELAQALPHVLAAPATDGPVTMLCTRPKPNTRIFRDQITLTWATGVQDDKEHSRPWLTLADGSPDPRTQVALLPSRVLDLVWRDRDRVAHPGDTVIADLNMSLANLPVGTLLQAGTSVLRVTDVWNDGCAKWKVRYGKAAYDWVRGNEALRLRGIFCAVEQDGVLTVGDRIVKR